MAAIIDAETVAWLLANQRIDLALVGDREIVKFRAAARKIGMGVRRARHRARL